MMRMFFLLVALIALVHYGPQSNAQPFTELIVFGDSHSDTGNWAPDGHWGLDPAYLVGRFSNGPNWVEELAVQLGLPLPAPSEASGLNYAWGGARTGAGFDRSGGMSFPKVGTQVRQYLSRHVPDGNELVTLFPGHNDFGWGGEINASIPALNIGDHITALATAGINHFLVPNLHPLGHLPEYRGTSREATLYALTADFNEILSAEIGRLEEDLGVTIFQYDLFSFVQGAIEDPASLGLVNVTDPAFSNGAAVPNPDEYLYWDNNHFTTSFYAMMGQQAAAVVVPEPSTYLLCIFGIVVFGLGRLRSRHFCPRMARTFIGYERTTLHRVPPTSTPSLPGETIPEPSAIALAALGLICITEMLKFRIPTI